MKAELYFPPDEYEARWERVSDEMTRQGFDVALVWSRSAGGHEKFADVFYLTHYFSNQSGQADEDAWLGVGFAALILEVGQTPELIPDLPDLPEEQVTTDRATSGRVPPENSPECLRIILVGRPRRLLERPTIRACALARPVAMRTRIAPGSARTALRLFLRPTNPVARLAGSSPSFSPT